MTIEDPDVLLRRMRLGREEYSQRLLTMLIIGEAYPRWNSVSQPSTKGLEFLNRLYLLSFGRPPSESLDGCSFIDEFDLPARHDEEKGGAPDYAVVTATLLWVIELKTEPASHRRGQLSTYMELAKHHHPNHLVELTYLTPSLKTGALSSESVSYGHITWGEVMTLIGEVWAEGNAAETRCCEVLTDVMADLDTAWTVWREQRIAAPVLAEADPMAEALSLAGRTAVDGQQRALDYAVDSLDQLKELRIDLRDRLVDQPPAGSWDVRPWLWNSVTTDGVALTASGREVGYELRLSKFGAPRGVVE